MSGSLVHRLRSATSPVQSGSFQTGLVYYPAFKIKGEPVVLVMEKVCLTDEQAKFESSTFFEEIVWPHMDEVYVECPWYS